MKKQAPILQKKQKDSGPNRKAILWAGSIVVGIIILMTVLLILQ